VPLVDTGYKSWRLKAFALPQRGCCNNTVALSYRWLLRQLITSPLEPGPDK
jgi:hypothetical protein